eukprot:CAMPEP_0194077000 /NCGR_PEP_ID=MMETSP0149-20130528/3700_1 /TAXON_ID=122233 /ORGANISM="Chaetoceros debilis, Strain MM31A-1" /LENGTH=155 /DNA_ID=CAMNT_0038757891 /DNA_START=169 /DNA_END=636 /DNA_ORIENTATION=-
MTSKILKNFMQKSSTLDEMSTVNATTTKKKKRSKRRKLQTEKDIEEEDKKISLEDKALQSAIDSVLFFDTAFSARTTANSQSLENQQQRLKRKKRKKSSTAHAVGNSRSSSSKSASRKISSIPNFNQKTYDEQKKVKDMADLARRLRKDKKAGRI